MIHQTAQRFLRKRCLDRYVEVKMSGLGLKVTGQLDIWYLYKTFVSLGKTFLTSIMISAETVIEKRTF